jgi:Na+-transporting methylmalonyl-CoA/oxaloacetate decarboxylase gamma subunit
MPIRLRRGSSFTEPVDDEGPFVSFTDLFIGILFLFLILVAALMLMQQEVVQREKVETQLMAEQIKQLQAKVDAAPKRQPDLPAFRLGIVFNIYQRSTDFDGGGWTYSRTVRVFRSPDGHCINTVWMRSNLSTAWRPPTAAEEIPSEAQQDLFRTFEPCGLSASGDHWESASEMGKLKRTTADLYSGYTVLHKKEGDEKLEMQYRILGIYDDYFRYSPSSAKPS